MILFDSDPSRENSQSSTDTASSTESTPLSAPSSEIKIKQEPVDAGENGTSVDLSVDICDNNFCCA